ncbi:MAG: hypothetical protein FWE01_01850 [Firmicutes bacterium]|nr:hypothetical protein [Bacillota bacterium]
MNMVCLDIRSERNFTPNRLANKPSKGADDAEEIFNLVETLGRQNTYDGEQPFENFIKINNVDLSPEEIAIMIEERLVQEQVSQVNYDNSYL